MSQLGTIEKPMSRFPDGQPTVITP